MNLPNEVRSIRVLVYEYVTGGGMVDQELPESWAAEGTAMRRAIAEDFARVPGVKVVMPIDGRLEAGGNPLVSPFLMYPGASVPIEALAANADYTVLIAPETDGILLGLTDKLRRANGRSMGSGCRAIGLTGNKARLARHFQRHQIPTPPTCKVGPKSDVLPGDWEGPSVVKPRDGAGSIDTVIVHDRARPAWLGPRQFAVTQPYLAGRPMSASFLVDAKQRLTLLGVGRQRVEVDPLGRITYQGGTIYPRIDQAPRVVEAAVRSVGANLAFPGLQGFVGVDYIDGPDGSVSVLEINPRPTTSYVALAKALGPGTIAGAWLVAMNGPLDETDWPERIQAARTGPGLTFNADGTFVSEGSDR